MLQVAERIGKGAYGSVWQATILNNKQDVVVKVVYPDQDLDPEVVSVGVMQAMEMTLHE